MELSVKKLDDPSMSEIADILNLFRLIPGRTCSAAQYLKYLVLSWERIAIFVACSDKIEGFTQAEAPGILEPVTGYLPFSYSLPQVEKKYNKAAFKMAEDWLRSKGAKEMAFYTVRKPEVMARAWNCKKSKETKMYKELTNE